MSTGTWDYSSKASEQAKDQAQLLNSPIAILRALGSLKITVVLFVLAILIVLVGTLAQDDETLVEVKREYFNAWIAQVPLDVFIPSTMYAHKPIPGVIPMPGGALIGLALLVNLIAAKATRFTIFVRGTKLAGGIAVSALGAVLVTLVILTGHASNGLQGKPPISYEQLWSLIRIGMLVIGIATAIYALRSSGPALYKTPIWGFAAICCALAISTSLSNMRLDDPGLRIVWQLAQATVASCVVLAGCMLLFGRRGGNVLIHVGVALLMVGQFVFGDRQIEQKVYLSEGETSNVTFMPDQLEIAIIDTSSEKNDAVTVIPDSRIRKALKSDGVIDDPNLPCIVRIDQMMGNSRLESGADAKHKVTVGIGLVQHAVSIPTNGGAKSSPNFAAAYVTLLDRQNKQPIETLLLAQELNDGAQMFRGGSDAYERLTLLGKSTEIALRYRKDYKPYKITLEDVTRRDYANSNTPRDYSSVITIHNPETNDKITEKTWMNNPVRFGGETFYQSDYFPVMLDTGKLGEGSGLQVVKNAGWVIPYVCCMMVMVGMIAHFSGTFLRFANRFAREQVPEPLFTRESVIYVLLGLAVTLVFDGLGFRGDRSRVIEADWKAIGKLPVKQDGRIKPLDTIAGYTLQALSEPALGGVTYVTDQDGNKRSQVEWLLGVMADVRWTKDAQVFRIYAKEVRELLQLDEARKNFRYSYNEITKNREAFFAEVDKLREKSRNKVEFNFREQKISDVYSKLTSYELLSAAYDEPALPRLDSDKEEDFRAAMVRLDELDRRYKVIEDMKPPAMIPPISKGKTSDNTPADADWYAYGPAKFDSILQRVRGVEPNPSIESLSNFLRAVQSEDAREINSTARKYRALIADSTEVTAAQPKLEAEAWLNSFRPVRIGVMLYILSTIVAVVSFATHKTRKLRHLASGMILGIFIIHTLTLLARMYISGRAPVVNLYSSAVFIGWACVLLSLILELVIRLGFANIVGSLIGLISLCIAGSLDKSDTMHVLAAVLDTQFWLSTHVVIITLGYAVTYLAGFFGAIAAIVMLIFPTQTVSEVTQREHTLKQLDRMAYFSVCFGILFSFVGTVLGGLWADDSWGRFWGWDPKENGALMIVLWNALVLHARWDRMVGLRGFCILALVGNIVTSWSWFGTNLLGIGLHFYGFNEKIAMALIATLIVHFGLIVTAFFAQHRPANFTEESASSE